ncbi:expression library immunization antigen 1 [Rhexocercosporidium sp. MPI-PUGE-AT-0058]|nr:expression library immunization antigen 1 [Rhexocercosporidium sp. MPI-PUGE-AT-0058]
MRSTSSILALAALLSLTTAHFNLNYPAARALTMGHIDANVAVFLAMGNEPGSAFNTVLRPTFKEQGLGAFCMTGLEIPEGMDGMNATIQVVTNGDPEGGLYNCADVTFSKSAVMASSDVCKNATGVETSAASVMGNPNVTSSSSASGSNSTSGKSAASAGGVGNAWVGGLIVAGAAAWAAVL